MATSRKRRRAGGSVPGLGDDVGAAAIERDLKAAAAAEKPPAANPTDEAPPPPPQDLVSQLGLEGPPSPLKTPIQTLFGMAGGLKDAASKKAKPEDLWKLPDWEANLYGRCAEVALAKRQLSLERYAEWVLLFGLGGRVLFNFWLLKKQQPPAAAPAPAAPAPAPAPAS